MCSNAPARFFDGRFGQIPTDLVTPEWSFELKKSSFRLHLKASEGQVKFWGILENPAFINLELTTPKIYI